jgi:hypothetical protein
VASAAGLNAGDAAFETLFHEVLHTMDGPLENALRVAARTANKKPHRDPPHAFIFYSAGEVTRSFYPTYTPMAESLGVWARTNRMDGMLPLLKRRWLPWIDGRSSFDEAIRGIVAEI